MKTVCAWCIHDGSVLTPANNDELSHGICRRHERELLIEAPLQGLLGQLRGREYLGEEARKRIAATLATVVFRSRAVAADVDETVVRPALACPRCLTGFPERGVRPSGQGIETNT
jgi:hypothetical protein